MVRINGEDVSADGKILKDYLLENGYTLTTIAVERNGEILPKAQYETAVLNPDDVIEIVSFVGGGCSHGRTKAACSHVWRSDAGNSDKGGNACGIGAAPYKSSAG